MTVYFFWSIWQGVLVATYNAGQQSGSEKTIVSVIQQAMDKKCEPFNVYAGENKADLINVACLKQASEEQPKKR